jgi:hypothetical protein
MALPPDPYKFPQISFTEPSTPLSKEAQRVSKHSEGPKKEFLLLSTSCPLH